VKRTTFTYTITKLDGSTYDFDVLKEEAISAPEDLEAALAAAEAISPLNAAMLKFCFDAYGSPIGDGQCYALGAEPLKAIGAVPAKGTEFGDEVSQSDVAPGDIAQFTWCKFKGDNPAGGYYTMYAGDEASNGAHTAVVYSVQDGGDVMVMLEQNIGGMLSVTHRTYRMKDKYEGSVQFFRPKQA